MILSEGSTSIETHWIFILISIIGTAVSVTVGWVIKSWWDWKKKERENTNEEEAAKLKRQQEKDAADLKRQQEKDAADLKKRKDDLALTNEPVNRLIRRLEEEVLRLEAEIETSSKENLGKIFEVINKESEAQRKVAVLEEQLRSANVRIEQLLNDNMGLEERLRALG